MSETLCERERICTVVGIRLQHSGRRSEPFALGLPVTAHLRFALQYQQQPITACGKHMYHLPCHYTVLVLSLQTASDCLQVGNIDRAEPGGRLVAGIAGSIPAEVMDVRLLSLLCQ